jgi:hypothetical protein
LAATQNIARSVAHHASATVAIQPTRVTAIVGTWPSRSWTCPNPSAPSAAVTFTARISLIESFVVKPIACSA